jgi:hypothetical protein
MEKLLSFFAICGIVYLERLAISKGIDGVALSACAAVLGTIVGYGFKYKKRR